LGCHTHVLAAGPPLPLAGEGWGEGPPRSLPNGSKQDPHPASPARGGGEEVAPYWPALSSIL
jgi:hypothetical protein